MIYKNDPELKDVFLKKLLITYVKYFAYYAVFIVGFNFLIAAMFDIHVFNINVIELIGVALVICLGLAYRKSSRRYDVAEVELTDEFIELRINKFKANIPLNEIVFVSNEPSAVDKNQLVIRKKMGAIAISSYLNGVEEIKEKLLSKVPEKKVYANVVRKSFWNCVSWISFAFMIIGILYNKVFVIVGCSGGILFYILRIIIVNKSLVSKNYKKTVTVTGISFIILFSHLIYNFGIKFKSYTMKKTPGRTLHVDVWSVESISKYDKDGNMIYYFDGDVKYVYKYDEEGREIYFEDKLDKYKSWTGYDSVTGKANHSWDSGGFESWTEYNEDGKAVHHKANDGYEWWKSYNKETNTETYRNTENEVRYYEYDDEGNVIHSQIFKDEECTEEYWYKYDDKGNEIYSRDMAGNEDWSEYDEDGNLVFCHSPNYDFHYEYDENGNKTYYKQIEHNIDDNSIEGESETWYEYNSHNDVVMINVSTNKYITYYDYSYDKNGNILKEYSRNALKKE